MSAPNTIRYALTDGYWFQVVAVDRRRRVRCETGRSGPIRVWSAHSGFRSHSQTLAGNCDCAFLVRVKLK